MSADLALPNLTGRCHSGCFS